MPKTYPDLKKEQWLVQLSRGKSPKQIARKEGCDQRTVIRAAQEIRSRHAAQEALTQLYQDALREHMNRLNSALDMVIEDLKLPDPFVTEIAWSHFRIHHTISNREGESVEEKKLVSAEDSLSDNALLAEHLRNSKPWRVFADWSRNLKKHRNACGQLQEKALSILIKTTGISEYDKSKKADTPFLHAENSGDLLCRAVIKHISGAENPPDLEKELNVDPEHGAVRHNSTVLAEGIMDTDKLSECRGNIIKSFRTLQDSSEAQQVLNIFKQLEQSLPKVKYELRAVRLMGVIPGQCRVCHEFGL